MDAIIAQVSASAAVRGYSPREVEAGLEHFHRKTRLSHPAGKRDNGNRSFASERTSRVRQCRSPSLAWPLSQMQAARTAAHCAEFYGVEDELAVQRVARAAELALEVWPEGGEDAAASAATLALKLRAMPAATMAHGLVETV